MPSQPDSPFYHAWKLPVTLNARTLLLICSTSACWAFSFGLGSQVVSHWLNDQGENDTVIGLAHSFYYFGMAIGSFLVPRLTRRFGVAGCATIGMVSSGVTLALFPCFGAPIGAYLLRFLNGWAGAMSVIPLELVVSRDSAPEARTQNFGYYGLAVVLGGSLGMGISLHLYEVSPILAFLIGSAPPMTGLGLLAWLGKNSSTLVTETSTVSLGLFSNFLSYGTGWCQGFLEGGMVAFLSLYVESLGHSKGIAGAFVGVTTIGVIVFQVPVSWLADRCGKTPMLLACYGVVAAGLLVIPGITDSLWLAAALFAFGACSGAMYPLGLSMLGDRMPESGLARAYAWYLAIECIGSQVGAAAVGKARDLWGEAAMFGVGLASVGLVLAAWLGVRYFMRTSKQLGIEVTAAAENRQAA